MQVYAAGPFWPRLVVIDNFRVRMALPLPDADDAGHMFQQPVVLPDDLTSSSFGQRQPKDPK